jgi:ATP-dependent helicase Lhr and Lhr-like helicase
MSPPYSSPCLQGEVGRGHAFDLKSKSTPPHPSPATEGSPFGVSRGGSKAYFEEP